MRISDWSSDVCSSDLLCKPRLNIVDRHLRNDGRAHIGEVIIGRRLIRAGGFDRAADATEEVNFPGGVRTQTKAAAVLGIAVEITSRAFARSHLVIVRFNQSPIDAELEANAVQLIHAESEALQRPLTPEERRVGTECVSRCRSRGS